MGVVNETEVRKDGTTIYRTITTEEVVVNQNFNAPVEKDEQHFVTFLYDGVERVVADPHITRGQYNYRHGYNPLLSGIEVLRDGVQSNQYKHFSLNLIRPV